LGRETIYHFFAKKKSELLKVVHNLVMWRFLQSGRPKAIAPPCYVSVRRNPTSPWRKDSWPAAAIIIFENSKGHAKSDNGSSYDKLVKSLIIWQNAKS
jgi:hypothetical protein